MPQRFKEQQMLFIHSVNDKMFCIWTVNQDGAEVEYFKKREHSSFFEWMNDYTGASEFRSPKSYLYYSFLWA